MVNWDKALKDALEAAIPTTAEGWALRYECPELMAAIRRLLAQERVKGTRAAQFKKDVRAWLVWGMHDQLKYTNTGRLRNKGEIEKIIVKRLTEDGFKISGRTVRRYLGEKTPARIGD